MAVEMSAPILKHAKEEWARQWLAKDKQALFVDGKWQTGKGERFESINPADGEVLGAFNQGNSDDVDRAVEAARNAFSNRAWRAMTRQKRAELLVQISDVIAKHHDELATIEALDNGKLFREAYNDDIPEASSIFKYYAGWIDKAYSETCPVEQGFVNYTVREPLGVCALIAPWNFPHLLSAWKIAPALAMGNTVVLKPSPFTSLSAIRMMEIIAENVELPSGVLNLVTGGATVGTALTKHANVDKVSFTGSSATGKRVLKGSSDSNLKTVSLELGGKSANIIFDDVPDIDFAIQRSFDAMFSHKGEKCSEPTRLIVSRSHYELVLERFKKMADATVCGSQFNGNSTQGAQCHHEQFDKIIRYMELGKKSGARLIAVGEADTTGDNQKGFFVRPTVFADVDNASAIAQEEIFGPGCYDFSSPFGGIKQSGWGKEMAIHSLDAYTRLKSVWSAV